MAIQLRNQIVYSFGVLLLEFVTGKRPTDSSFLSKGLNIVGWLNTLTGEHRLEEIVDERSGDLEVEAVEAILDIAAMCTHADPSVLLPSPRLTPAPSLPRPSPNQRARLLPLQRRRTAVQCTPPRRLASGSLIGKLL